MSMQIARKVVDHFRLLKQPATDLDELTPREQEVLALLAKGFFYKEISHRLGISFHTFRNHQRAIYEKLHVRSRTEATLKYLSEEQHGGKKKPEFFHNFLLRQDRPA